MTIPVGGDLCAHLQDAARAAGGIILRHYRAGSGSVGEKEDGSPVTRADTEAEEAILRALAAHAPDVPVVAEEAAAAGRMPRITQERFFLVDALDGTREYLSRTDAFTVNIALVVSGRVEMSVVYAPAHDRLFYADGSGAFEETETTPRRLRTRAAEAGRTVMLMSRSHEAHAEALRARYGGDEVRFLGSSLKFCLIAAGEADMYVRTGPTMAWDTAAGQGILEAAGGSVHTLDGAPFTYEPPRILEGKPNSGFVAQGRA